jgi:trimethylamine--corrinoid protein Co-methyltransferase
MAHHWGVPSLAGVFATDAAVPGWQSAGDAATSLLLCALVGAETGSGLGLLESCRLLYPEEILLDSDIYHRVRLEVGGLDTTSAALAVDLIREVGPRGHFLRHAHTRDGLRKLSFSDLTNQPAQPGRYLDPVLLAQEKLNWIREHHHPQPLGPAEQKALKEILQAADSEFSRSSARRAHSS